MLYAFFAAPDVHRVWHFAFEVAVGELPSVVGLDLLNGKRAIRLQALEKIHGRGLVERGVGVGISPASALIHGDVDKQSSSLNGAGGVLDVHLESLPRNVKLVAFVMGLDASSSSLLGLFSIAKDVADGGCTDLDSLAFKESLDHPCAIALFSQKADPSFDLLGNLMGTATRTS